MSKKNLLQGRYQLIRELGSGGMGSVFEGHDNLLDRRVAVKVISKSSQSRLGSEGKSRLMQEAKAAARLNHPNIVDVYDAGEADETSFIVMELIQGDSLYECKPESISELFSIASQICAALEHAHAHGVIHRDLKPENILVTPTGAVKLTDFGLAVSFGARGSLDEMVVGTVLYMAPEAAAHQQYDGRSDLYSLGVILYELSTGIVPFSAEDPLAILSQHLYAPVVPPRAHNPEIPTVLDTLIVQLLSKRPEDRPANAGELRRLLESIQDTENLGIGTATAPEYSLLDRITRGRLVGRERELAQMIGIWRQTASEHGSVLFISGEPGIGKTRLARELVAHSLISGGRVLSGACYAEGGVPYDPFPQIIREMFEESDAEQDIPRFVLADLIQIAPDLRPRYPDVYPNPPLEPQSEQQRIFESVASWLGVLSAQSPVLLFIDDVHWADSGTLSLLRYLARRTHKIRLLIMLPYRELELDEFGALNALLHDLNRERISERIKLIRFNRGQSQTMLASILSPNGNIDESLVDQIYYETEGNPFFIEEVCKALIETGKLRYEGSVWSAEELEEIDIPQSVRVTLQSRLGRLPKPTQEVLRCASVLGRQFDADTLQIACGLDEEELIVSLESAERAQIITEIPRKRGTALSYEFVHTLIPATLAEQLSGLRLQRLHHNAAQAIEVNHPDDYEALGYHFERAGDTERACVYYHRAGERALARYANQEAERYLRSALELEIDTPDASLLLSSLGEALFRQSRYEEARSTWDLAIERYNQAGDFDNQARLTARQARAAWYQHETTKSLEICRRGLASLGNYMDLNTPGVAALIHETARAYYFNNLPDEAMPLCQHALHLAKRLGLVEVQADTLATLGILPNQSQESALEALKEAVELSESAGLLAPAVRAHSNLGETLHQNGDLIAARDHFLRSREIAQRMGSPDWEHSMLTSIVNINFLLGEMEQIQVVVSELKDLLERIPDRETSALQNRFIDARLHRFKGEFEVALAELRTCSQEAKGHGLFDLATNVNVVLAELLIEQTKYDEAGELLDETLNYKKALHNTDHPIAQLLLSVVRVRQDRLDEARQLIESVRSVISTNPFFGGEVFLNWSEAQLAAAQENWDELFMMYRELERKTAQLGVPWYRARLLAEAGRYHLDRGLLQDSSSANQLFDRSIEIFQELGLPLYAARIQNLRSPAPIMEFHISRSSRDRYQFDETLFSLTGNVLFANFHAVRQFAQKINQKRDLINFPEKAIRAGQINALGLIDEILHMVIALYRQQRNPDAMQQALEQLYATLGEKAVDGVLLHFTEEFPPLTVYRREVTSEEYLKGESGGISNRQVVLEELLMLWIANANPACATYLELFDDADLRKQPEYLQVISGLEDYFASQPPFGPESQALVEMLRSPAIVVPHSLTGQLEYIRTRWGSLLGRYLYRLLSSLDLIKEEDKIYFTNLGSPPAHVLDFAGLEMEAERFSPDQDWMPNLVLIAKNTYVWLDQLSKKYQRSITRLDQIPEEELRSLADWGFTGLWLIGLWERSPASKRIKQLRGNPEAVASAYSLQNYDIAADLGGEAAYQELRRNAWRNGIRLASDMVPNHMGIDSNWVIEHPDWFISLDYSPFPSYSFNGPDLSYDSRVGLYLEDHYFDNSDAAVVFKRVDNSNGNTKYIYHGNDGTSFPWNDTAQLNYLLPEVREAVIQTILHVARKFQIIRFDAAMTLAKRHFQRLWFPEPGSGGDIPSRAEHGLNKALFDGAMPVEFWREVVDRVAQELPGTLLLAEAFWLMEGYFVRTLGMHRVYNSAFMNMLRDEKNQEYRLVIKNTLEFDPEILKRYVSFMNNPDERTAVEQFGKGDKYFGICTLLATLPGLPMFGHGQIEGYTEKYGMEYRRAYWDEHPDTDLVERHKREIFPLLKRRYIFAEARHFLLYDFFTPDGSVNEDVYAYSNRSGDERALVVYHNKYASARGWIRTSAAYLVKPEAGHETPSSDRIVVQSTLGDGLGLANDQSIYTIFRDSISGLEFIRNNQEIHSSGLYIELDAYNYHVFLDFRQVRDEDWRPYSQLSAYLNGRGVPSIDGALNELLLQSVHQPFGELANSEFIRWMQSQSIKIKDPSHQQFQADFDDFHSRSLRLLDGVRSVAGGDENLHDISRSMLGDIKALCAIPQLRSQLPKKLKPDEKELLRFFSGASLSKSPFALKRPFEWSVLFAWIVCRRLGAVVSLVDAANISRSWIEEWQLARLLTRTMMGCGLDEGSASRAVSLVRLLTSHQACWHTGDEAHEQDLVEGTYQILQKWLQDAELQQFLGFNRYQEILWFNKESFDEWLWWAFSIAVIDGIGAKGEKTEKQILLELNRVYAMVQRLKTAAVESDYQVDRLMQGVPPSE